MSDSLAEFGNALRQPPAQELKTSQLDGITFAIPNWNHEYLLPRSISSALRACHALRGRGVASEVLVVDDGSRDGSLKLLRQLEALLFNQGLRLLAHACNAGPAVAREQALLNATYRYILFLDADNQLIAENVYQFYRAIKETRAAVVYGNLLKQSRNPQETQLISHESFQARIFNANYIDTFALVDRLQVLDSCGYLTSEMMKGREDWELYMHLASDGRRLVFVPLVLGYYYDLPGSLVKDANENDAAVRPKLWRAFNQLKLREILPLNTRHLRYHPDIGYL